MATPLVPGAIPAPPLRGELRYGLELARLLRDRNFVWPGRHEDSPPVLLVPGFMAGDQSLSVLAGWLRRRGSAVSFAGMLVNSGCAERAVAGIEQRVARLAERTGEKVVLIGQSRGGGQARVAALRNPDVVSDLVMLGSPVLGSLDVGPGVLRTVRSIAWLGDRGVPGMFSSECGDGPCCESFREQIDAPLPDGIRAVAVYSKTDGIVSWRACLDPGAEHVEVASSHTGMSVHADVYRVIARVLDREESAWTG
jgi:pimeloyl-ACP methyl ester carboxylesterase